MENILNVFVTAALKVTTKSVFESQEYQLEVSVVIYNLPNAKCNEKYPRQYSLIFAKIPIIGI